MPARLSASGGAPKTPKKVKQVKTPRASVPSKSLPHARSANASYGPNPVTVYTTPRAVPKTTVRAANTINAAVGARVLKPVRTAARADIVVRAVTAANMVRKTGPAAGVGSPSGWNDGQAKGRVSILGSLAGDKKFMAKSASRLKQHEIGHALGLAHPGPKKNPYVGARGGGARSRHSGVMGSGDLNRSEVRRIRRLRGLKAQPAGIPAVVGPKKAVKAEGHIPYRPVRGRETPGHGHGIGPGPTRAHAIRTVAPHGHAKAGKPSPLATAKAGNLKPAIRVVRKALYNKRTPYRIAVQASAVLGNKKVSPKVFKVALRKGPLPVKKKR